MRTKSLKRRMSNIVLLGILLAIVVGIYYNIYNSRAENVVEIPAIAVDNYGYLGDEEFNLEGKDLEDGTYEITMPESINGKKVLEVLQITLKDKEPTVEDNAETENAEATEDATTTEDAEKTEDATEATDNKTDEAVTEDTATENNATEDASTDNTTTEEPKEETATENNATEENTTVENETTENSTISGNATIENTMAENTVEVLEIKDNKITLTQEQIDTKEITLEVKYDMAILATTEEGENKKELLSEKTEEERQELEITEETEVLYSKILKYEDEENEKIVELKGYLPKDAQLKVVEVKPEDLKEVFGNGKIDVAYDITILIPEEKQVTNEDGTVETVIEYKEVNPEEFGETCEVSIKDSNIVKDSQVYHVKDDKTYEKVNVKENSDESIKFEASNFSTYAVSSDEGIATTSVLDEEISNTDMTVIPSSTGNLTAEKLWKGWDYVYLAAPNLEQTFNYKYFWAKKGESGTYIELRDDMQQEVVESTTFTGFRIETSTAPVGEAYLTVYKTVTTGNSESYVAQKTFGPYYIRDSYDREAAVAPKFSIAWNIEKRPGQNISLGTTDNSAKNAYYYYWSKSSTNPGYSNATHTFLSNSDDLNWSSTTEVGYYSIPAPTEEGTWYLHITHRNDEAGDYSNESYGPYLIDETDPWADFTFWKSDSEADYATGTWTNENVVGYITWGYNEGSDLDSMVVDITKPDGTKSGTTVTSESAQPMYSMGTASQEGTYTIVVTCTDVAGNSSTETRYIHIDKTAPNAPSVSNTGWHNSNAQLKLSGGADVNPGTNAISGRSYYYWKYAEYSNEEGSLSGTTANFAAEQNAKVGFWSVDAAGNWSSVTYAYVKIDKTKPTAGSMTMKLGSSSGSAYTNDTWTTESVYIALDTSTASDSSGPTTYGNSNSGVSSTTYSVTKDGSSYLSNQTGTNTLTETGTYVITVTTTDVAGNSATRTYTVKIDKTAPTGTISASTYLTNQPTVTVYVSNLSDAGSGVSSVTICAFAKSTAGSSWLPRAATWDSTNSRYYATFSFSEIPHRTTGSTNQGDGIYYFDAHIYDGLGNDGFVSKISVTYDTRTPNILIDSGHVTSGLIRHYEAINNTGAGGSTSTTVWKDLSGYKDSLGNYNDGTISGATWGSNSSYLTFDGTDDYVACGPMNGMTTATIDTVISINTVQTQERDVMCNFNSGGFGMILVDGVPSFQLYLNGAYVAASSGTTLSTGTKYRLTGTYDGSNIKIYINGTLKTTVEASGAIGDPTGNTVMMIGANPNGSVAEEAWMDGNVYSARVYNRALSATEISQNISADAANTTWRKGTEVTVNLVDDLAGLATGASMEYGWSTSLTSAPSSWTTASVATYSEGASSTSFTASASGLTGKYYLWVKPVTLADIAGTGNSVDTSLRAKMLKQFYFDNTKPTISILSDGAVTAADIYNDPYTYYGKSVTNYTPSNRVITGPYWRIFHSDGNNIYLISQSLVPSAKVPAGQNGTTHGITSGYYARLYNSSGTNSIVSDYTTVNAIANKSTTSATAIGKWLRNYSGKTAYTVQAAATAYLMDTDVWSGFVDSDYGVYAIGGPTVELFTASYNKYMGAYNSKYSSNYPTVLVGGGTGYRFRLSTASSYSTYVTIQNTGMYTISGAYWLASPSAYGTTYMNTANYSSSKSTITYSSAANGAYIRPVVCLDEDAQLIKSGSSYLLSGTSDATEWSKSKYVTVQIQDSHSGLASGASIQYGWSTSSTTAPTSWETATIPSYTAGTTSAVTFTAKTENELTGKYYLWVKPVTLKDTSVSGGNSQTSNKVSTGTFWLDNTAPQITLGAQGNSEWVQSTSVGVTIKDDSLGEHSGLASGAQLQYGWSTSNTTAPTSWTTVNPSYTAGTTSDVTFTATASGLTGRYYLWVKPVTLKDLSVEDGNSQTSSVVSTGVFYLDVSKPNIRFSVNPVTDGLIRYYEGTNNTGAGSSTSTTVWKDLSGHYSASMSGATVTETYVSFDGTDDYATVGQVTGLTTATLDAVVAIDTIQTGNVVRVIGNWENRRTWNYSFRRYTLLFSTCRWSLCICYIGNSINSGG